jgi:hypothetical protein
MVQFGGGVNEQSFLIDAKEYGTLMVSYQCLLCFIQRQSALQVYC